MDPDVLPYMRSSKDAKAYWNISNLWWILAEAKDTGGAMSLMEQLMPKKAQPAVVHLHEEQYEAFYILEGEAIYTIGDQVFHAKPGDFVTVPKNTWHTFQSMTQGLRVLNFYTPGGFERLIMESGTPATSPTLPPDDLPPPDRKLVQRLLEEIGCRVKHPGAPLEAGQPVD